MAQVSSRQKSHLPRALTRARGEWQQGTQGPGELMAKRAEVSGATTDPSEGLVAEQQAGLAVHRGSCDGHTHSKDSGGGSRVYMTNVTSKEGKLTILKVSYLYR